MGMCGCVVKEHMDGGSRLPLLLLLLRCVELCIISFFILRGRDEDEGAEAEFPGKLDYSS